MELDIAVQERRCLLTAETRAFIDRLRDKMREDRVAHGACSCSGAG